MQTAQHQDSGAGPLGCAGKSCEQHKLLPSFPIICRTHSRLGPCRLSGQDVGQLAVTASVAACQTQEDLHETAKGCSRNLFCRHVATACAPAFEQTALQSTSLRACQFAQARQCSKHLEINHVSISCGMNACICPVDMKMAQELPVDNLKDRVTLLPFWVGAVMHSSFLQVQHAKIACS